MVDLEVDPGVQRNSFCSSYVGYWSDIRPERAIVAILQGHSTHLTTLEPPFQKSWIFYSYIQIHSWDVWVWLPVAMLAAKYTKLIYKVFLALSYL